MGRVKPGRRPGTRLRRLDFAIAWWGARHQRVEKLACCSRNLVDGAVECDLVRLGRSREAAQLSDELERGSTDFFVRRRRFEVMEGLDVPAHGSSRFTLVEWVRVSQRGSTRNGCLCSQGKLERLAFHSPTKARALHQRVHIPEPTSAPNPGPTS